MSEFGSWLPAWGAAIAARLVTIIFLLVLVSIVIWIIRLHFSAKYQAFDLVRLVTHPDGAPDPEKIRLWATYLAGLYAFLHLLVRQPQAFLTYGPWFLLFVFTHLVATRLTAKPTELPKAGKPPDLEQTKAGEGPQ